MQFKKFLLAAILGLTIRTSSQATDMSYMQEYHSQTRQQVLNFSDIDAPFYEFTNCYDSPFYDCNNPPRLWRTNLDYFANLQNNYLVRQNCYLSQEDLMRLKEGTMVGGLCLKFHSHLELAALLMATDGMHLVENTYLGNRVSGNGLNMLGTWLMNLREEFLQNSKGIDGKSPYPQQVTQVTRTQLQRMGREDYFSYLLNYLSNQLRYGTNGVKILRFNDYVLSNQGPRMNSFPEQEVYLDSNYQGFISMENNFGRSMSEYTPDQFDGFEQYIPYTPVEKTRYNSNILNSHKDQEVDRTYATQAFERDVAESISWKFNHILKHPLVEINKLNKNMEIKTANFNESREFLWILRNNLGVIEANIDVHNCANISIPHGSISYFLKTVLGLNEGFVNSFIRHFDIY